MLLWIRRRQSFDPRSREGSDARHHPPILHVNGFDPRSREGSDRRHPWGLAPGRCFDPRSREGSDIRAYRSAAGLSVFRSTLPRRERPGVGGVKSSQPCFDPRSREGSDHRRQRLNAWGRRFDPRSREGSDCLSRPAEFCGCHGFDPRSREGSDIIEATSPLPSTWFRSTLPRRERRCSTPTASCCIRFDPRSREGSDFSSGTSSGVSSGFDPRSREGSDARHVRNWQAFRDVSIHAPAKGATGSPCPQRGPVEVSIHAPAKGATSRGQAGP